MLQVGIEHHALPDEGIVARRSPVEVGIALVTGADLHAGREMDRAILAQRDVLEPLRPAARAPRRIGEGGRYSISLQLSAQA